MDHKSQLPFVNYNGGGLRNPGKLTNLELTSQVLQALSQRSDGVGRCSWALKIPKCYELPEKRVFRPLEQIKNFIRAKKQHFRQI